MQRIEDKQDNFNKFKKSGKVDEIFDYLAKLISIHIPEKDQKFFNYTLQELRQEAELYICPGFKENEKKNLLMGSEETGDAIIVFEDKIGTLSEVAFERKNYRDKTYAKNLLIMQQIDVFWNQLKKFKNDIKKNKNSQHEELLLENEPIEKFGNILDKLDSIQKLIEDLKSPERLAELMKKLKYFIDESENFICPIVLEPFTDKDKELPVVLLSSGRTISKKALEDLIEKVDPFSRSAIKSSHVNHLVLIATQNFWRKLCVFENEIKTIFPNSKLEIEEEIYTVEKNKNILIQAKGQAKVKAELLSYKEICSNLDELERKKEETSIASLSENLNKTYHRLTKKNKALNEKYQELCQLTTNPQSQLFEKILMLNKEVNEYEIVFGKLKFTKEFLSENFEKLQQQVLKIKIALKTINHELDKLKPKELPPEIKIISFNHVIYEKKPLIHEIDSEIYKGLYEGKCIAVIRYDHRGDANEFLTSAVKERLGNIYIDHPNILRAVAICETSKYFRALLTELPENGRLFDKIESQQEFTPSQFHKILTGLAKALVYFEKNGLQLKRLRASDVYLTNDYTVKVSPFNDSIATKDPALVEFIDNRPSSNKETVRYYSPEIFLRNYSQEKRKNPGRFYPLENMYAFGVILWEMLSRKTAYGWVRKRDELNAVKNERLLIPKDCLPEYKEIIENCWLPFEQRLTPSQLLNKLKMIQLTSNLCLSNEDYTNLNVYRFFQKSLEDKKGSDAKITEIKIASWGGSLSPPKAHS